MRPGDEFRNVGARPKTDETAALKPDRFRMVRFRRVSRVDPSWHTFSEAKTCTDKRLFGRFDLKGLSRVPYQTASSNRR
jgi:hypothetical protein